MIQDEKQVDMAHLPSIDSESGSPPDYSSLPQSDPDVEKAFAPAPPSWDVKDSKTSAPSEEPPRRRKTFRLLASLLALCLLLHLFSHPFHSRTDRRAVRGYVTSYKSTSNWSGPTEPLRGINFIKSIYWRLRTRPGWRHRFGKPVYDAKKPLTAKAAEKLFLSVPTNDSAQAASHSYTGFSHLAGTEGDRKSAALVKYQWEQLLGLPTTDEYENVFDAGTKESRRMLLGGRHGRCRGRGGRRGWKTKRSQRHGHGHGHGRRQRLSPTSPRVWTDRYYPLLSFPHNGSSLQLLSPSGEATFNATLFEDAIELDPTASHGSANDPPFHGYSFPGWAEGELVYANEGTKADFEALEREGIDVKGKVVLVRYGAVFRGLKVTAAERRRAVGVIIYTDPSEDGHTTVSNGFTPYPHGPARNPSSLQRGSVQTLSFYPGDPLTPGKPAYKDAKRIDRKEKEINVPGIPSLPLSGKEGKVLLESLKGKGKKLGGKWDGGFEDVDYWTGPGEKVRLFNNVTEKVTPIWNTYALIPGHIPDEVVVIGNHRDAWVFGAGDPNSGTASVHEIIRGLSHLLSKGWRPLRTILIASWDAEELGLVGSTEFAEDYEEYLVERAVAYLNVDVAVRGSRFTLGGSPSLANLLVNVSDAVSNPDAEGSLLDALAKGKEVSVEQAKERPQDVVKPLGSGSDYTPFLQHVGISSSDLGFGAGPNDPVYHYHSIYDSGYWMDKFGDPGFHRHVAVSQVLGLAALRLADSLILPINATTYSTELSTYLSHTRSLASDLGFPVDKLGFGKLGCAIGKLEQRAVQLHAEAAYVQQRLECLSPGRDLDGCRDFSLRATMRKARQINKRLAGFERGFIDKKGLQGRPWYRSLVQAPGRWLGYGATPLPGVTEAMAIDKCPRKVVKEVIRLAKAIRRTAASLEL